MEIPYGDAGANDGGEQAHAPSGPGKRFTEVKAVAILAARSQAVPSCHAGAKQLRAEIACRSPDPGRDHHRRRLTPSVALLLGTAITTGDIPWVYCVSGRLRLGRRRERDGRLGGEQEECERLLQVEADGGIGVTEIADGDVLTDVQAEIAATGG